MRFTGGFSVLMLVGLVAGLALLGGCAAIDLSIPSRNYTVNAGWDAYRNDSILLNIARASHAAPMEFVAVGPYSGSGQIATAASAQFVYAAADLNPVKTYGPFSANGQTSNNIQLSPLETAEFYRGMLTEVQPEEVYYLLRQGTPREIAFNVLIERIRITRPDGAAYDFRNDPSDNFFAGVPVVGPECAEVPVTVPFADPIWLQPHEQDCRYEKFRRFVQLAIEFGLTVQPVQVKQEPAAKDKPATTVTRYELCYDAAVAREHGRLGVHRSAIACRPHAKPAAAAPLALRDSRTGEVVVVGAVQPVFRSPVGAFRYLGGLLTTGAAETLMMRYAADPKTGDRRLLTVLPGLIGCFATAEYLGKFYCVPAEGAQNTKDVFSVLATLVALHTKREDIPPPSTLLIRP